MCSFAVRGMMYYKKALLLQAQQEGASVAGTGFILMCSLQRSIFFVWTDRSGSCCSVLTYCFKCIVWSASSYWILKALLSTFRIFLFVTKKSWCEYSELFNIFLLVRIQLKCLALLHAEDEEEGHDIVTDELALVSLSTPRTPRGSLVRNARSQAELKFCHVVTAQNYGKQKNSLLTADKDRAADLLRLMQMWVIFLFFTLCPCSSNIPCKVTGSN